MTRPMPRRDRTETVVQTPLKSFTYCGGGSEQTPLMHVVPAEAPQQSLLTVHLSPSCAQPFVDDAHTKPPPSGAAPASPAAGAQYPPQHCVPDWHPSPSPSHGSSAQ